MVHGNCSLLLHNNKSFTISQLTMQAASQKAASYIGVSLSLTTSKKNMAIGIQHHSTARGLETKESLFNQNSPLLNDY